MAGLRNILFKLRVNGSLHFITQRLPVQDTRAHDGATVMPRVAGDGALDYGGGHAVRLPKRLHDAHVAEEELDDAHVIPLYGVLDGGVAVNVDGRGVAAPVLEEELGPFIVAFDDGQMRAV